VIALAGGLAAAGAGTAGLMLAGHPGVQAQRVAQSVPAAASAAPFPAAPTPLPEPSVTRRVARPVAVAIPAIGVSSRLIYLGLAGDGTLQVPPDPAVAGWYTGSPAPGATGSAIIVGHIDSLTGPAVFYRLSRLRARDLVDVRRADGTTAVFRVDAVRMYPKDDFPTASVYGPTPDAELRLITCGGVFDPNLKSYLSNVVVYATAIA